MPQLLFQSDNANTPLTPEEALDLIPSITLRTQLNELERYNIAQARAWALREAKRGRLDVASDLFPRELHRRMFSRVWKWAGRYRTTPRNLGWEAHRITEGMKNLMEDFKTWVQFETYSGHEAVVRLHHKMVVIHPWPNGNGRHSRLMADVCLFAYFPNTTPLTWGSGSDLLNANSARSRYIDALRSADNNDFAPLLAFAKS